MKSVLFVCTANMCRSPMAMALLRDRVKDSPDPWRIESAGTWVEGKEPAVRQVQTILAPRGIDISQHRSQPVSRALLVQFNLILVMERSHKEGLRTEFRELANRIYLFSEMADGKYDIRDPMGGTPADFEYTLREMERYLDKGFEKIAELAKAPEV